MYRGEAVRGVRKREKTPWVDSACADCPGFLVSGAADARFLQEPQRASLD